MLINLVDQNMQLRTVKVGFSWTVLFFGFLVPIFRGDWLWAVIMFAASVCSIGIAQLVFCFIYNRIYIRGLLSEGYMPADEYSRSVLIAKRFILV